MRTRIFEMHAAGVRIKSGSCGDYTFETDDPEVAERFGFEAVN